MGVVSNSFISNGFHFQAVLDRVNFNSLISTAMVTSGKGNELMNELKLRLADAASQSETAAASKKFIKDSDIALAKLVKDKPEFVEDST